MPIIQPVNHALRSRERAFGLIEVIVAMLIVSIVVTAGVTAIASSDRAEVRAKAVADLHSVAERAFERAQGDLSERSRCDRPGAGGSPTAGAGWRDSAASTVKSGGTAPATFSSCVVRYPDIRDEQGRTYVVQLSIRPNDDASDGTGTADVDNDLRDDYKVVASVDLAADSRAGAEGVKPITVDGSLDWTSTSTDLGTVRIHACGINRPDRSLTLGGCATADAARVPLGGLTTTLTASAGTTGGAQWNSGQTRTITTNGNGIGDATAVVEPGVYSVTAPASFKDVSGVTWNRFRVEPGGVTVTGAGRYDINVTYVRANDLTINFCTQISTPRAVLDGVATDDGFEAYSTNVIYRGAGSPGYRIVRVDTRRDRGWACSKVTAQPSTTNPAQPWLLLDPYAYGTSPYLGQYDLEIEQQYGPYRGTNAWSIKVDKVSEDCSPGLPWNAALNGTPVPTRPFDPANDRPVQPGEDPSWYGRYTLGDMQSHRICIRLQAKTFDREKCTGPNDPHGAYAKGAPYAVPADAAATGKCFYVKTDCTGMCPSGGKVCTAHCNPPGTVGGVVLSGQAAKPFGGPGDSTVGCRPRSQGAYQWFGWKPSVILAGKTGQQATRAQYSPYQWVGGWKGYYEEYSGQHSGGGVFYCENIVFAASWKYLCKDNSNAPAWPSKPGFVECRYRYNDCIQASFPQYPGVYVRGIMKDVSINWDQPILPSIAAMRALAIQNGLNRPETINGWSPGTWWDSLNLDIRIVSGDPSCGQGSDPDDPPWPRTTWVNPVFTDVWHRVVDEPGLVTVPPRASNTNVASDRVAI